VQQPAKSKFQIDFNHMSDWADFEYKKVLGVYEDDERLGPMLVSGPPSKVDK